jgi:exodeoxyribonuclease VII small subunit
VSKQDTPDIPFEEALSQLETLVERMESGELSLEDSLASFEQGVALTRRCQQALEQAEQKVKILTANSEEAPTEPFDHDD